MVIMIWLKHDWRNQTSNSTLRTEDSWTRYHYQCKGWRTPSEIKELIKWNAIMDNLMYRLLCDTGIEEATEMLRELRELSEMSQEEREIYALLDPDAQIFAECDVKSIIESREEILAVLN